MLDPRLRWFQGMPVMDVVATGIFDAQLFPAGGAKTLRPAPGTNGGIAAHYSDLLQIPPKGRHLRVVTAVQMGEINQ